jgi:hypothetical protein
MQIKIVFAIPSIKCALKKSLFFSTLRTNKKKLTPMIIRKFDVFFFSGILKTITKGQGPWDVQSLALSGCESAP